MSRTGGFEQAPPAGPSRRVGRGVLAVVLVALAATSAWRIGVTAISQTYALASPETWAPLTGASPTVLAVMASRRLAHVRSPADLAAAQDVALRALARSPIQVEAIRDLALIAAARGQTDRAAALMRGGAALSRRDRPTQAWLMAYGLRRGAWSEAMEHADAFLRTDLPAAPSVGPILAAAAAQSPIAASALARQMTPTPPWRGEVLRSFARTDGGAAALAAVLNTLERNGGALSPIEVEGLSQALLDRGASDQAFLVWAQAAPPQVLGRAGDLYQGDFSPGYGPPPFGWRLRQPAAGSVARTARPDGAGSALKIELDDNGAGPMAEQTLLLTPGRYLFTGRGYAATVAPSGQAWRLHCRDGKLLASIAPPLAAERWTDFRTTFEVGGAAGCDAQQLVLEASPQPSGGLGRRAWWTGLAVDRIDDAG